MAGFTFVGREGEVSTFRQMLERPQGELLLLTGPEGTGKSHLLRQFRYEAERQGRHVVQHCCLGHLLDGDLRQYALISALAAAHEPEGLRAGEAGGEPALTMRLMPNPREFFGHLLGEDQRPVADKLLGLFAVASGHLPAEARLVLLLDLGRAEGRNAFPIETFARRLPEKTKLVIAANGAPEGVESAEGVTILADLPPFGEAEVRRLLEFHHPHGAPPEALVHPALAQFHGSPLLTDLAVKLVIGAANPATALASLPATAAGLCQQLLGRLNDEQRRLAECVARVPSGVDTAALRAFLGLGEADVRRVLLSDAVSNVVVTRGSARGTEACVFHESFADLFLGEKGPEAATFHRNAAAHFLGLVMKDPHDIEALGAHSYHIRLSGDRMQFMQDFPRTLKLKQNLGLLHLLAGEYRLLLMWSRSGDAPINRPLCMANLARIYQQLGDSQEALRQHRDALEIYQKQNDRSGTAAQLAYIASVLSDLGHHEEAAKSLQQAISINEVGGNKAAQASDLASLGQLQERSGGLQSALQSHQRALAIYRDLKNEVDAASQLACIAALHRKLGNPREAVARYQEAWRLNNRINAARAEIANLCQLGLIFEETGDMEKAVTCMQQAVELDHSLGDRHAEAGHLRTLGAMHLKTHEADEAIRCIEQAVTLSRAFGDPGGQATGLLALAQAHRAAGRATDARRALEQAAALAARLSDAETQAQAHAGLEDLDLASRERPAPEPPPPAEVALRQEEAGTAQPAAAELLADEMSLDETPAPAAGNPDGGGVRSAAPGEAAPSERALVAALRLELEQARKRIAELRIEVQKEKDVAETLKDILAKAMQSR